MRKTRRTSRVGESVRDALVDVFRHEIKDLDLGLLSITGVEVSPDMHFARVFISGLDEKQTKDTVRELQQRQGFIRSQLGKRIRLRSTPELDFKFDETAMRAGRIESILADVRSSAGGDDEDSGES
jgi:ribosome-binding factor A